MNNNNRLNRKRTARIAPNLKDEATKRVFHIELTQTGTKDNLDITSNVSGEDVIRIAAAIAKARVETLAIGNEKKNKRNRKCYTHSNKHTLLLQKNNRRSNRQNQLNFSLKT